MNNSVTLASTVTPAKHTEGPWMVGEFYGRDEDCTRYLGIYGADQTKIAVAETWRSNDANESEANARLMAAAPDLLAALEKIDSNAAESVEWIRRVAREAISKATA